MTEINDRVTKLGAWETGTVVDVTRVEVEWDSGFRTSEYVGALVEDDS